MTQEISIISFMPLAAALAATGLTAYFTKFKDHKSDVKKNLILLQVQLTNLKSMYDRMHRVENNGQSVRGDLSILLDQTRNVFNTIQTAVLELKMSGVDIDSIEYLDVRDKSNAGDVFIGNIKYEDAVSFHFDKLKAIIIETEVYHKNLSLFTYWWYTS